MPRTLEIFVKGNFDLPAFAKILHETLGFPLEKTNDPDLFEFLNRDMRITLCKHELENDAGIVFSRYPLQISLRVLNIHNAEQREAHLQSLAQWVFEVLKKVPGISMILVDNLQKILAEFPAPVSGPQNPVASPTIPAGR